MEIASYYTYIYASKQNINYIINDFTARQFYCQYKLNFTILLYFMKIDTFF